MDAVVVVVLLLFGSHSGHAVLAAVVVVVVVVVFFGSHSGHAVLAAVVVVVVVVVVLFGSHSGHAVEVAAVVVDWDGQSVTEGPHEVMVVSTEDQAETEAARPAMMTAERILILVDGVCSKRSKRCCIGNLIRNERG